jgi:preprotein translocase subunit SecG
VILAFSIVVIVCSLILTLLVLLHKGRGGGLSDLFGGGVSSSLGGSSVAERNLDRITIGVGLIWFAAIVALGLLYKLGWRGVGSRGWWWQCDSWQPGRCRPDGRGGARRHRAPAAHRVLLCERA